MIELLLLLLAGTPEVLLRDVAAEAGVTGEVVCGSMTAKRFILEENGSGAALFDYDGDGDLDLYLVNGSTLEILDGQSPAVRNMLYRNDGSTPNAWRFTEVSQDAGVDDPSWGTGVATGDIDGDGDDDLYVTNFGRNVLYENQGDGTFRDITEASGTGDLGWGHSAAFFDADGDGDLDLYVANNLDFDLENLPNGGRPCSYRGLDTACGPVGFPAQRDRFYRNDGNGRFIDASEVAGFWQPEPRFGLGVVAGDLDGDDWTDLVVANDSGPNFLFQNQGAKGHPGIFEEIGLLAGVATQAEGRNQAGMGIDLGDIDADGDPDLAVTNFSFDHDTLYRNQGELYFTDDSYPSGLGNAGYVPMSWGTRFLDINQDGRLDLYVANGHIYPEVDEGDEETFAQQDQLYLGDGKGRFVEADGAIEGAAGVGRGVASGDLDGDGDLDLVVVQMGRAPALLRNEGSGPGFLVELRSGGEGLKVAVQTAGGTRRVQEITRSGSYASSSEGAAHFALPPNSETGHHKVQGIEVHRGGKRWKISGALENLRKMTLVDF